MPESGLFVGLALLALFLTIGFQALLLTVCLLLLRRPVLPETAGLLDALYRRLTWPGWPTAGSILVAACSRSPPPR